MRGRESGFPALTTPTGKAMVPSLLPRRVSGPEDGLQRRQLRGWTGTGRAGGYVVAIQSSSVCSKNLTAICCYRTLTRETRETPERHPQLLLPSVQRTWGRLLSAAPLWGAGDAVTRTPPQEGQGCSPGHKPPQGSRWSPPHSLGLAEEEARVHGEGSWGLSRLRDRAW